MHRLLSVCILCSLVANAVEAGNKCPEGKKQLGEWAGYDDDENGLFLIKFNFSQQNYSWKLIIYEFLDIMAENCMLTFCNQQCEIIVSNLNDKGPKFHKHVDKETGKQLHHKNAFNFLVLLNFKTAIKFCSVLFKFRQLQCCHIQRLGMCHNRIGTTFGPTICSGTLL